MPRRQAAVLLCAFTLLALPGCQEAALKAPTAGLKEACARVDPGCRKVEGTANVMSSAARALSQIRGLCDGLETGSAICMLKLRDLAGVMGQVGTLAGAWESVAPYGYKAGSPGKVQVATAGTRYWVGAKDNKGGIYVNQVNRNLVCASTDFVPEGVELATFLDAGDGAPGDTKEDLMCEKVYPGFPLCLGTYVSMCVSSGAHEGDRWAMNTEADEACVRAFSWRTRAPEGKEAARSQLHRYIQGMAVELNTCALRTSPKHGSRMRLECGDGKTVVFADELRRN